MKTGCIILAGGAGKRMKSERPKVLCEVLKKHGVVASFFLVGNNINDETAKAVKYAYDLGCEIDNHSKTHPYMN